MYQAQQTDIERGHREQTCAACNKCKHVRNSAAKQQQETLAGRHSPRAMRVAAAQCLPETLAPLKFGKL